MFRLSIITTCLLVAFKCNAQDHPRITSSEKAFFLNFLDRTENDLLKLIESTTDQQWNKSPDSGWSPGQIMTHILDAEKGILYGIHQIINSNQKANMDLSRNDAWLLGRIIDRGVKVNTPLDSNPQITSRQEAEKLILESHDEIRIFIAKDHSLREYVGQSPYGSADAFQLLLVLAGHSQRHYQQMLEVLDQQIVADINE